ncbi:hypothetical protein ACHWQZ_G002945 [Mnemiopsis leidyi]
MELSENELFYSKEETISEGSSLLSLQCEGTSIEDESTSTDLIQIMDLELEKATTIPATANVYKGNTSPIRSSDDIQFVSGDTESFLNCLYETSIRKWRCLRKPEKNLRQAILLRKTILKISDLKKNISKKRRLEDTKKDSTKKRTKSKTLPVKPWEE